MGYYNFMYALKRALKTFVNCFFTKKMLIIIIIILLILLFRNNNSFASTITSDSGMEYVYNNFFTYEDIEYSEEYGWTCLYDLYTQKGHFVGNFHIKDELLEGKKYVMLFYPDTQDIYIFYTPNSDIDTFYFYKIKDYNGFTYVSTIDSSSYYQRQTIGELIVLKYNKETFGWDEVANNTTGYFHTTNFGFEAGQKDYSNYGLVDPENLLMYSGVQIQLRIYDESVSGSQFAIDDNLFFYRGYSCYLPQISSFAGKSIDLFLGCFQPFLTQSPSENSAYFGNFRDAEYIITIKDTGTGQMFTDTIDLTEILGSDDSDWGFVSYDISEIMGFFPDYNGSFEMTITSSVYLDKYGSYGEIIDMKKEPYVTTKYDYFSVYSFNYSNEDGISDFTFITDSSGTDGFHEYSPSGDDDFSSSIEDFLDKLPGSDDYNDTTSNFFDTFFNTLKSAFTGGQASDIVFTVPFSNGQNIVISSDLTENIVPVAIASLIRAFYWFIICRFIVKDIAKYIEKIKSGDILSKSDTNIKTEML